MIFWNPLGSILVMYAHIVLTVKNKKCFENRAAVSDEPP